MDADVWEALSARCKQAGIAVSLDQLVQTSSASVLVLTRGESGASLFHDGQWHDEPVAPMDELKDTVGAGDTFMAKMLVWLVQNRTIDQLAGLSLGDRLAMVRRATQAAAINCSRQGCNPPFVDEMPS